MHSSISPNFSDLVITSRLRPRRCFADFDDEYPWATTLFGSYHPVRRALSTPRPTSSQLTLLCRLFDAAYALHDAEKRQEDGGYWIRIIFAKAANDMSGYQQFIQTFSAMLQGIMAHLRCNNEKAMLLLWQQSWSETRRRYIESPTVKGNQCPKYPDARSECTHHTVWASILPRYEAQAKPIAERRAFYRLLERTVLNDLAVIKLREVRTQVKNAETAAYWRPFDATRVLLPHAAELSEEERAKGGAQDLRIVVEAAAHDAMQAWKLHLFGVRRIEGAKEAFAFELKNPRWIEWHSGKLWEMRRALLKDGVVKTGKDTMDVDLGYESN
ncbi:hypothetical protein LTS18_002669 [Coniosporium uncinatum]|uniref:Uncharacterized protein n=1 Tax=Coniosporium uncinatum TaxID=93489 RepID=A0ACC3DBQ9_9PEZI|nr:hypothetical protein LTS18_002669 [Coniosporium uncinatum]